jgi:hypothetical protein
VRTHRFAGLKVAIDLGFDSGGRRGPDAGCAVTEWAKGIDIIFSVKQIERGDSDFARCVVHHM